MGSPEDGMLEMRKRKKFDRLKQQQKNTTQPVQNNPTVNLNTCDLGASPNMMPKAMKKPYRSSPLQQARQSELTQLHQRNKK